MLEHERHNLSPFGDNRDLERERLEEMETVAFELPANEEVKEGEGELARKIDPHPFVPSGEEDRAERCKEIFSIQTAALAKRLDYTGISNCILGISGGLDSTLALLVTVKAIQSMGLDRDGVLAVTMPGLATSERTRSNAVSLMEALGLKWREIDITEACRQHFSDIGHDGETEDVTYENVQARERTQILMDLANKEGGLVVGTGDLSELALGWCTYNGDHMSMYAVNVDVPKTLVKYVIRWVAESGFFGQEVGDALHDIIETPITPELTQAEGGRKEIDQQTEEIIGPYELHDFFLYQFLRYGFSPKKILFLAKRAFADQYGPEEIEKWLELFYDKFFSQQFKRSCLPDGPKVGSVSLSPRTDWRMPSDVPPSLWKDRMGLYGI